MKFKDYEYIRPDYENFKTDCETKLLEFAEADSVETQLKVFNEIVDERRNISTMMTLAEVRFSLNTEDSFYVQEKEYWDLQRPLYEEITDGFYQTIMQSKWLEQLKKEIPEVFFMQLECAMKSFDSKIIPELQEENKLTSEHARLIASAQIEFEGEIYNLPQLNALTTSADREYRHRAYDARISFFEQHESEFDEIYDKLVKVRDKMAKKMGYENYVPLGYYRMYRLDYDEKMVANYRQQILSDIVPIANSLYQRQLKRLGYETLRYYDEKVEFVDGNATPQGSYEEIVSNGQKMYHELSSETAEFIDFMIERDLLDLVARKGKEAGGYCTYIDAYDSPFIFSNFNGTSGDIDVLTHEAGHAFQCYQSRWIKIPELNSPTMESCEIHSMSMEFFAHPWMELFFKDMADKYRFSHVVGTITFLPYGVLVDHFQHEVYHQPDMSPAQRKETWRKLEKQYLPHKNYEGSSLLEKGGWWFQQSHIFEAPFYYIDYTLAQVCALQFFKRIHEKDETAWKDYLHLCKLGGTKTFTELVKEAHLIVPFEDGCVSSITKTISVWLDSIDDTKL